MRTILTDGAPELREKVAPIEMVTPEHIALADEMVDLVLDRNALGLAANQIGVTDVRVFVGLIEEEGKYYARVFFNPEVVEKSDTEATFEEGCLSVPKFFESFKRPKTITLRFLTEDNELVEEEFTGMNARLVQHETDHLDGILFTDYVGEKYEEAKAKKKILF